MKMGFFEKALYAVIILFATGVLLSQAARGGQHGPTIVDQINDGVYSSAAFDYAVAGVNDDLADGAFDDPNLEGMIDMTYLLESCVNHPDPERAETALGLWEGSKIIPAGPFGMSYTSDQEKLNARIRDAVNRLTGVDEHPPIYSTGP